MSNCRHILKHDNGFAQWKSQCTKAEYKEGLCKKHYERMIRKATLYRDRKGYREATVDDLVNNGPMLYLKDKGSYGGHKFRNGKIINGGSYKETGLPADPTKFMVKINTF